MRSWLLLPLALLGCDDGGCASLGPTETETEEELLDWLRSSQEDGIEDADHEAYMRIWADDATLIMARTERPGPYDVSFDVAQIDRASELRYRGERPYRVRVSFHDERVHLDGDRALVRWVVRQRWTDPKTDERSASRSKETYRLERQGDGWEAVENRWWPIEQAHGDNRTELDEAYFRKKDEEVAEEAARGESLQLVFLQMDAHQHVPAYETAVRLTEAKPDDATAWRMRGVTAEQLRKMDDAIDAYRRAGELDPDGRIPSWVEAAK